MDISNEQFITVLRSALHHLYNPEQLRRSPLIPIFGLAGKMDAASALQQILLGAIDDLRPGVLEQGQASGWRVYEVLCFRYVRGYAREAIANQLAISDRQLSRALRAALDTLALRLWQRYRLDDRQEDSPSARETAAALPNTPIASAAASWIESLPSEKLSSWKSVLVSVLNLLDPLIRQNDVTARYAPSADLPDLAVPLVALRHSLLNILSQVIPFARQGELVLTPMVQEQVLTVTVKISLPPGRAASFENLLAHPNIEFARQLIERAGGDLNLAAGTAVGEVRFSLPASAHVSVLLIDDNADIHQLFQRYAQGSRYAVSGVTQPKEAYPAIETLHPRLVVLDVMMPDLDGWDLFARIRQEPRFQDIAIIICSILPEGELARSLGADGFLQKPVLPQDFLKELDRQIDDARQSDAAKDFP